MGDHGSVASSKRGRQTARDMVLSMLVVLLGAGIAYLFIPHDDSLDPVRPISYDVELVTARRAAPYPVAAPVGLPADWRATSVDYEARSDQGAVWHLGFMDPDNEYAAVEQSDGSPGEFITEVTHGAEPTGRSRTVGGEEWEHYEGPKYDALVRREPGVTTVVTGTAPLGSLTRLAAALETSEG
ncbi:DUF4245 domain-containing protein [Streptomyces sp. TRM 70361]|uniref:DUF4245 domain-containing protein n=1 Tax=Streptomyces sp. TRM 70361 TaxID=3116553 RepID=UPI002E7BC61B|nr:DUF4245 domain-containing protein [Streptomyces sp. TRM 70361]MEE1939256.1 DUF4245 domain-containing protein [Streptomyces sp. TRM 70361]